MSIGIDDEMKTSCHIHDTKFISEYPKPIRLIKDGHTPHFLYPFKDYYRGQVQHVESGAIKNSSRDFSDYLLEYMGLDTLPFYVNLKKRSKLMDKYMEDMIRRICSCEFGRNFIFHYYKLTQEELMYNIYAACNLVIRQTNYYDGINLIDCMDACDIEIIIDEISGDIFRHLKRYKRRR